MTQQKMHENEIEINADLVLCLIREQFPEWQSLPVNRISSAGTDNALFRLGDDKLIRMPRMPESVAHVEREQKFLPIIARHTKLAIPTLVGKGRPGDCYPWHWSIMSWIEGDNAWVTPITDLPNAAIALAEFIKALWQIDATFGPSASRSVPLVEKDDETKIALSALKGTVDAEVLQRVWQQCLSTPKWTAKPVWFHGDLLPTNLIVREGQLAAVIDFDLMGVGDPAIDLIPAWCLFDADSRQTFRNTLGVDEATWLRGCGWALSIALIIIPYYRNTNPGLTAVAMRMLNEILSEVA